MQKKIIQSFLILLVLLVATLAINTFRKTSKQLQVKPLAPLAIDERATAERLAAAVRLKTVSSATDANLNAAEFKALHALLTKQFPKTHAALKREVIDELNLLYTWQGADTQAKPILLLAHQDVVPVAPGTERDWQVAPFAGVIKDGFIWGRGSWDDKGNLLAQLEAVELLVASGYKPQRTIYFAYGADEEVSGLRGAKKIAAVLKSRSVALDFVLDEGLLVLENAMPGLAKPAALVGIAEKGYVSVRVTVSATPGHSSMPPKKGTSAIALLSRALVALENEQMPAAIGGVAQDMFATLAPDMTGFSRLALSNLWLLAPIVRKQLEAKGSTNAMIRTTTALTVVNAGNKENVLPGRAEATINFRILPGDTIGGVLAHVKSVVEKIVPPEQLEINALPGAKEASQVAPIGSAQYTHINQTIREIFPDAVVTPALMIAATDSIHYEALSNHIFKFSPIRTTNDDLKRFHGTNERMSTKQYADAIRFYYRLLQATPSILAAP